VGSELIFSLPLDHDPDPDLDLELEGKTNFPTTSGLFNGKTCMATSRDPRKGFVVVVVVVVGLGMMEKEEVVLNQGGSLVVPLIG
jgi:hypothetical protein